MGFLPGIGFLVPASSGPASPAWPPFGALTFIDFANGHYWASGAERSLADMHQVIDNGYWTPGNIFNPSEVTAGVGWTWASGIFLFSATAMAGWLDGATKEFSAIIEGSFSPLGDDTFCAIGLSLSDGGDGTPAVQYSIWPYQNGPVNADTANINTIDSVDGYVSHQDVGALPATFKMGITFNATGLYLTLNGAERLLVAPSANLLADYANLDLAAIQFGFEGAVLPDLIIERVTIFPPMSNAALDLQTII